MKNEHEESKKIFASLIVGGLVGAGIVYFIKHTQHQKVPVMKTIGKTISEIGQMIENTNLSSPSEIVDTLQKKMSPSHGNVFSTVSDWIESGLELWKKVKKE